jgi:hypothetical protein
VKGFGRRAHEMTGIDCSAQDLRTLESILEIAALLLATLITNGEALVAEGAGILSALRRWQ